ncbi:MAG: T9SS type A sorting domain-containing protein, partial [Aquaticitalea sp.]
APVVTEVNICSDEEYTWSVNGVTYTTAQDITIEGEDCAADQRLVLTINEEPAPVVTEVNICSDEEYTWSVNGVTYTTAQDINIEGEDCAADQRLVLTINPEPEVVTTTANICSDEEYTWSVNGVTYTTAQDITIEGEDCAADQRLVLTINEEPAPIVTEANICSDEEYTWSVNGVTYTTAQDITIEGEDCAADQRLVLTINEEPAPVVTEANICSDEEYTWSVNGVTYTTAQDITIEGEDCAADQRLVLTINEEPAPIVTEVNICSDEEYTWSVNGVTYTTAQDITIEGEDCAADQRLVLTINPEPEVVTTTANICSDEEYTWSVNGVTYTTAQDITIEGEDCAADQRLILTVNPLPTIVVRSTECNEESQLGFYAVNVSVNGGIVTSNLGNPVDNGSDSWTISGIPAISNVIITVTASSGCTNSIEVQAPACNKKCVELEVKHINVSCYGLNDGHIFVDFVTEGAIVYVNNELYDPNAFYAPGIYTVWAFFEGADDDKECDVKVYVEITQPVSVDFDVTYTDVTCEGENNGTITVSNLSEGANYTIQLDGAGPDLSGQIYFEPGMYYILASLDASPCTKGYFITIEEPKKLFCEIMMDFNMDNLRCRATIFSYLTAVATDGTGELSYAWEISTSRNGWSIISDPNEATIHFKPGVGRATFIVTITDENGCQTQCSREVTSTCTRGQGVTLSPTFAARNGNSDPYNVQLYPNPVKNKLNIKFEEEVSSDISVEVFDLVGSVVYKNVFSPSQIDNMTIDFSKFKSQVYYVKFTTVEGVIIKQVVLDK